MECGNTQKWENIPCVITSFKDAVQNTSSNIEHILCAHEKPETKINSWVSLFMTFFKINRV